MAAPGTVYRPAPSPIARPRAATQPAAPRPPPRPSGTAAYLTPAADRPPGEPMDQLRRDMQQRVAERAVRRAADALTRLLTEPAEKRRDERSDRSAEGKAKAEPAGPDEQPAGAAAPDGAGAERTADAARPAARARKRSPLESTKDEERLPEIETVPDPVTGPAALMRMRPALRSPSGSFDAPASLDIEPERRPDAKNQPPVPELRRYRSVFADAIAAARRLHDALLTEASREAAAAAAAEDARADRRQRDLNADLEALGGGLADSRARLANLTDTALALLDARAATGRARIARAAREANAALAAAKAKIESRLIQPRTDRMNILMISVTGRLRVLADGVAVTDALTSLKSRAEEVFPEADKPMQSAINEAIATRIPGRVERRVAYYQKEAGAELALLQQSFETLPQELSNAFAGVDALIHNASTAGPAAVTRAKEAALKRLNGAVRQLRGTVQAGRAATDAALVRQHDFGRAQLIEGANSRAHSETNAAGKRAAREIETTEALAAGQGKAVRAVIANMEREKKRPAAEFARAAVGAGSGLAKRIAEMSAEQLPRVARTGAETRQGLDRQSSATAGQLRSSADGMAKLLGEAAWQSGDRIAQQVDQGSAEFVKFADPVSDSIAAYLPPVGEAFDNVFIDLTAALDATFIRVNNALAGTGGGGGGDGGKANPKEPAPDPPPDMAPDTFHALVATVTEDARKDEKIATLIARSEGEVPTKMRDKGDTLYNALSAFSTNVETVMAALRTTTKRQGAAVTEYYADEHNLPLEWHIRRELWKTFSTAYTNRKNIQAALDYLHGNTAAAALAEMQAAVFLWNDEARVERVQRALTPEQMKELIDLDVKTGGAVTEVRNDLGGVDQRVFDALETQDIGTANALRLRGGIDEDRKKRGDEGADLAVDRLAAAAKASADDPIEGADPLGLDDAEEHRALQESRWQETQQAFAKLEPIPPGEQAAFKGPGAALYHYATSERNYVVFVPHEYRRPGDVHLGGHYDVVREGISRDQKRLMQMIIQHGAESDEAAGARLVVEMQRSGGKPKLDRLDMALRDETYEAHEGETEEERTKERERKQAERAKQGKRPERRDAVFALYDQYRKEGTSEPRASSPEQVKKEVGAKVLMQFAGDPTAATYAKAMVDSPRPADQAQAAFKYALAHEDKSKETLQRTFGRMNRDEINTAVTTYDENRGSGPSLYTKLGIRGQRKHWMLRGPDEEPLLSGDEANEIELASLGVPRNDKERADVALLATHQQIRDSGWLGRLLARKEYSRLLRAQARLEQAAGMKLGEDAFDEKGQLRVIDPVTGQLSPVGHFDETGRFKPPEGTDAHALDRAMHLAHLSAEGYRQATDRIATALTTGLMIIAAVVTTALTGGAAASIWIPVLVTAGAGLVGIGLSAAIKGDRYTRAELERDLVVTLVQAATAGLGAAAGVALRGGMPALRAVSSRMVVSEKVLERFMQVGGRGGLRQSLTLGDEALIAGGSNMVNSATAAAMDPQARRSGKSWDEAFNAGWRGFAAGTLGSAAMRPIMRAGLKQPKVGQPPLPPPSLRGQIVRRAFGSAASGTTTRATEIAWEHQRGNRMSSQEVVDEIGIAFFQNLAQGAAEGRVEHVSDAFRARRLEMRRAAAAARAAAARPPTPPPRPPAPAEAPAVPGRRPDAEAEATAQTDQVREALPPTIRQSAAQAMESAAPQATRPAREHPAPPPVPAGARRPPPELAAPPALAMAGQGRGDGDGSGRPGGRRPSAEEQPGQPRGEVDEDEITPVLQTRPREVSEETVEPRARTPAEEEPQEPGARAVAEEEEAPPARRPEAEEEPRQPPARRPEGEEEPQPPTRQPEGEAEESRRRAGTEGEEEPAQPRTRPPDTEEERGAVPPDFDDEPTDPGVPISTRLGRLRQRAAYLAWRALEWVHAQTIGRLATSKLMPKSLRDFFARFVPLVDLPERTVVMDRQPTNPDEAYAIYERMIRDTPDREAAIFRNPVTGEYFVVQGEPGRVVIEESPEGVGYGPAPAGGPRQRWKEILGRDVGRWEIEAHSHPQDAKTGRTGLGRRLPSGADADFGVLMLESDAAGGTPRSSRIHILEDGQFQHTDFGFDPTSTTERFWIDFPEPPSGPRRREVFATLDEYAAFYRFATGRDLAGGSRRRPDAPPTPNLPPEGTPPPTRGAAAAVPDSMFVAVAAPPRQNPAKVVELTGGPNGAKVKRVEHLIREVLPDKEGIVVDYRFEDDTFLISYPRGKDRERVRIRIEVVDPSALPLIDGQHPPAHFERHAGAKAAVKLKDADVVYVVRVSSKTDPLNVDVALAHEIGEIHRIETERLAAGGKIGIAPPRPDALTQSGTASALSAHDFGRLEQLRVRMDQVAAAQGDMGRDRVRTQPLRDDVHALVRELGLANADANGQRRLALVTNDPDLSQETRLAVSRAVADTRVEAALRAQAAARSDPVAEAAARARAAPPGKQRQAFDEAYEEARWLTKEAERETNRIAEVEAVSRAIDRVRAADPASADAVIQLLNLDQVGVRAVLASDTVEGQRRAIINLVARLRARGMQELEIGGRIRALKSLLEGNDQVPGLRAALQHERRLVAHAVVLSTLDPILADYVRQSPELSALLAADPDYVRYRFERHRSRYQVDASQQSFEDFLYHVMTENQPRRARAAVGEAAAIHHVAEEEGQRGVLTGGPGSHDPNAPGFDAVLFRITPRNQARPAKVPITLLDDKSHLAAKLYSAEAVIEHLFKNLAVESGRQERVLAAQKKAGIPVDPDHEAVVKQIRAAYDAINKIENDPRFKGRDDRFQDEAYIAEVRVALRKQRIRVVITSMLGNITKLSDQLKKYGIEIR